MRILDVLAETLIQFIVILIVFLILTFIGESILKKFKNSHNKFLNPTEFLPDDEIHTLRQVSYLILMALCFVDFFYSVVFNNVDLLSFVVFEIVLSLFIAITLDKSSLKNKVLLILLIPYGAFSLAIFGGGMILYFEYIRIFVYLYLVKMYFGKFMEYTDSNGLGVTIILLFAIIFISFFITQFVEGVNPLDSLVMVSNAFTSNGYAVLGDSVVGKINSIFLVWGGYIISGAGTATLTAAILLKHFNKRVRELEMLLEEGGEIDD